MNVSSIISMLLINGIVIGGFIYFLRLAIQKESK